MIETKKKTKQKFSFWKFTIYVSKRCIAETTNVKQNKFNFFEHISWEIKEMLKRMLSTPLTMDNFYSC